MSTVNKLFLQALKASLQNEKVQWEQEISQSDWKGLFKMAEEQHVLPMIYEAVYSCPAMKKLEQGEIQLYKRSVIQSVMLQSLRTEEFLKLYKQFGEEEIRPLIVKGLICRNLYPNPDYRVSGDEDILIEEEDFLKFHECVLRKGMQLTNPEQDIIADYEVAYSKMGSPIYIEAHKSLFPPNSEAYGEVNRYFENIWMNKENVEISGIKLWTLNSTDHLFYLICHAFKHFLHSGFGIRQVCDMVLFANEYGKEIDWLRILKQCREIHAEKFAVAIFEIGRNHLTFDMEKACYPTEWKSMNVDESMMLEDLLESGVYGDATMSRKHSSNITLQAVSAQKQGKKESHSLIKTVFPSAKTLESRYSYLKKRPYLLPIAWADRLIKYGKETKLMSENQVTEAVRIGNQRIDLLKFYDILNDR